eukprot:SAG31_NODE_2041_length_6590_cov_2.334155_6_plen_75_part_00
MLHHGVTGQTVFEAFCYIALCYEVLGDGYEDRAFANFDMAVSVRRATVIEMNEDECYQVSILLTRPVQPTVMLV